MHADNEDCADVQADLSLRGAHMSEGTFSQAATLDFKKSVNFQGGGDKNFQVTFVAFFAYIILTPLNPTFM